MKKINKILFMILGICTILLVIALGFNCYLKGQYSQNIKIEYYYSEFDSSDYLTVVIEEQETIQKISREFLKSHKNLNGEIGLIITGKYRVFLNEKKQILFDDAKDGYVLLNNNEDYKLIQVNPEILKLVKEIVDKELEIKNQKYQTKQITLTLEEEVVEITEPLILDMCMKYYKNMTTTKTSLLEIPETFNIKMDLNNNIEFYFQNENNRLSGYLKENNEIFEINAEIFRYLITEYGKDHAWKESLFKTDRFIVSQGNNQKEITDSNTVEKISTLLIYSGFMEKDWLTEDYLMQSNEYQTGLIIHINESEFLIPASKNIGNRYMILPDRKVVLCDTLEELRPYLEELLNQ